MDESSAITFTETLDVESAHNIYLEAIDALKSADRDLLKKKVIEKIQHVRKLEKLLEIAKHDLRDFVENMEYHKEKILFGEQ